MWKLLKISTFCLLSITLNIPQVEAQNENSKWFFGDKNGLDFITSPPSALTSSLVSPEGCASISDNFGNLLFYTSGDTVWNKNHNVMTNGTGLLGQKSSTQNALIVRKPGSQTIYYIFTVFTDWMTNFPGWPIGVRYSVVDMSLSAGLGSVTIKNSFLHGPTTEKIAATFHCNQRDVWIVTHDWDSNNNLFRSFLLCPAGVASTAVTSTIGPVLGTFTTQPPNEGYQGCMSISPDGSKLAMAVSGLGSWTGFTLYDFDPATGIVSNSLSLTANMPFCYGVEFSPDGTKLYGSQSLLPQKRIYQWDLSAGSAAQIVASQYTVFSANTNTASRAGTIKRAINNKLYVATQGVNSLGVINNPNLSGSACNYNDLGQPLSRTCAMGLPNNIITKVFQPLPFTYSVTCRSIAFNAMPQTTLTSNCSGSLSALSVSWNFGDPSSASNNTATLVNPVHLFTNPGSYTVQLIRNYSCGSDTINQTVVAKSCIGLEINNNHPGISIFPNPTTSEIHIYSQYEGQVMIFNQLGSLCTSKEINLGDQVIDLTPLPLGVYHLQMIFSDYRQTYKLVKTEY